MSDENGLLPAGWTNSAGDDLFEFIRGVSYKKDDVRDTSSNDSIAVLRAGNLQDGCIVLDDLVHVPESCVRDDQCIRKGDLIVATSSGSVSVVGKVAVAQEDMPRYAFGAFCGLLRPRTAEYGHWLSEYFQTREYRNLISQIAAGININNLRREHLLELAIPVPPMAEMRRLETKIEALQERSRKAREALAEVGPLLEQFRQSLLAAAFRGDLTADWREQNPNVEPAIELLKRIRTERRQEWEQAELAKYEAKGREPPKGWQDKYKEPEPVDDAELPELPDGWCWVSISELSEPDGVFDGARDHGENTPVELNLRTADYTDSGVRVIRLENLNHLEFDDTKKTFISDEKFVGLKQRGIEEDDILIGSFVADSMRLSLPPEAIVGNAVCKADVFTLRVIDQLILPRFVLLMLGSPDVLNRYVSLARGVTRPRINTRLLNETPIPLCCLEEQEEVIRKVHQALEYVCGVKTVLASSESDLVQLDQSILAKAFCGELVPQDPNDEPASVLLERICQQREAQAAKLNGKKITRRTSKGTV